jgi:apolipoprotein N-acyltransferase
MACYIPLFVGLGRVLVHRWGVSVVVAAPVVWTGLELWRAHVPDGFTMASLSHAHYRWPLAIQIADLAGGYGVSFVIVLAAACVARMIPWSGKRAAWWPVIPLVAVLTATFGYGYWRLSALDAGAAATTDAAVTPAKSAASASNRSISVALIQSSYDTTFGQSHEQQEVRQRTLRETMLRLSRRALGERPDLDLVIWPETLIPGLVLVEDAAALTGSTLAVYPDSVARFVPPGFVPHDEAENIAHKINLGAGSHASFVMGVDLRYAHLSADKKTIERFGDNFNSSLFVNSHGQVLGRYDKMHAVIFGEYMPLGDYLPWLYHFSPLRDGLCEGERPEAFELNGVRFCPSVCYESIMPHEIRGSVVRLRAEGREPDVLVNQTNSGWFWGSSELDLHLACNVLRAVECRKPMLVAANTGFSAWIADTGEIKRQGLRHEEDILYATVGPSRARSLYTHIGDWPAGLCLLVCGLAAVFGIGAGVVARRRARDPRMPH